MRILLQKVSKASVSVDGNEIGAIGKGYLLFVGVMQNDTEGQAEWLAEKIAGLRLFDGPEGKINDHSLLDVGGAVLIVSQFTLAGDVSKGNRPDYTGAAQREEARRLYEYCIDCMRKAGVAAVETGQFGAMMEVSLINDGPVTLVLER